MELTGQLRLSDVQIGAQKKLLESECIIEDAHEIILPGKSVDVLTTTAPAYNYNHTGIVSPYTIPTYSTPT